MPPNAERGKELYVYADCTDHVDGAKSAMVRLDLVAMADLNTYPKATEAGMPSSGRLTNERSIAS